MSEPDTEPQFGEVTAAVPPEVYVPDAAAFTTVNVVLVLAVITFVAQLSPDGVIPVTVTTSSTEKVFAAVYVTLFPAFTAPVMVAESVFEIVKESTLCMDGSL